MELVYVALIDGGKLNVVDGRYYQQESLNDYIKNNINGIVSYFYEKNTINFKIKKHEKYNEIYEFIKEDNHIIPSTKIICTVSKNRVLN
jgi:hypothetical protein